MADQIAFLVQAENDLWAISAERARPKIEIENADLEENPLVELSECSLVDDRESLVTRKRPNFAGVGRLVEELRKTETHLAGLWGGAPT